MNWYHGTEERTPQSKLLRKHKTHIISEFVGAYRRMDRRKEDRNEGFNRGSKDACLT